MDWAECDVVEVIPGKVSGLPLIRGTRMPADQVIESLALGETVEEIAHNHDVRPADVLRLKVYFESRQPALSQ